jgi:hypothetical protein
MNREDIIRMAREAHLVMYDYDHPSLERFAALVAAAEREECAQLAEGWTYLPEDNFTKAQIVENMCKTIAHYIRARGEQ